MSSDLDNQFEDLGFGGLFEGTIGLDSLAEFEAVGDQELRVDLARANRIERHPRAEGIHHPRRYGDVAVPEGLQVESGG